MNSILFWGMGPPLMINSFNFKFVNLMKLSNFEFFFLSMKGLWVGGLSHSEEDDDCSAVLGHESWSAIVGWSAHVPPGTFPRRRPQAAEMRQLYALPNWYQTIVKLSWLKNYFNCIGYDSRQANVYWCRLGPDNGVSLHSQRSATVSVRFPARI